MHGPRLQHRAQCNNLEVGAVAGGTRALRHHLPSRRRRQPPLRAPRLPPRSTAAAWAGSSGCRRAEAGPAQRAQQLGAWTCGAENFPAAVRPSEKVIHHIRRGPLLDDGLQSMQLQPGRPVHGLAVPAAGRRSRLWRPSRSGASSTCWQGKAGAAGLAWRRHIAAPVLPPPRGTQRTSPTNDCSSCRVAASCAACSAADSRCSAAAGSSGEAPARRRRSSARRAAAACW